MKIFRFKRKLDSKGIFVDEWVDLESVACFKVKGGILELLIKGTNDNVNTRYVMVTDKEDVDILISILNNEYMMLLNEQSIFEKIKGDLTKEKELLLCRKEELEVDTNFSSIDEVSQGGASGASAAKYAENPFEEVNEFMDKVKTHACDSCQGSVLGEQIVSEEKVLEEVKVKVSKKKKKEEFEELVSEESL